MNTEKACRKMPAWLAKAERLLYVMLLMASLATTIYWASRTFLGPKDGGADTLRAGTQETAPQSATEEGFASESDVGRSTIDTQVPVVADSQALTPPSHVTRAPSR
jgi:hypothetical protein